ncbi:MAG: class I SAM-dependent methyltransferase [Acidobacteriota bacterium]
MTSPGPLSLRIYRGLRGLKQVGRRLLGRTDPAGPENEHMALYGFLSRRRTPDATSAGDDFRWDLYDLHYRGEMEELARQFTLHLGPSDGDFAEGRLEIRAERPLHPNWRLLYETVLQLRPASVLELGCGNGMHLANLRTLMPALEIHGVDRSPGQLAFLRELHPGLEDRVLELDATRPFPPEVPAVDVAYTQAVLMHIQGGGRHREALANLFRVARRQVVLMENWERHPFLDDIHALRGGGRIPWADLHCYYRESPEYRRPHLLICSSAKLDYPELRDYRRLLEPAG